MEFKVYAKPEGAMPVFATPIRTNPPDVSWWAAFTEVYDGVPSEEVRVEAHRWLSENALVYPETGDGPACPTGALYDSYALIVSATREVVLDNPEIDFEERAKWFLYKCAFEELKRNVAANLGKMLYWRCKPEVTRMDDFDTDSMCWGLYYRMVFSEPTEGETK